MNVTTSKTIRSLKRILMPVVLFVFCIANTTFADDIQKQIDSLRQQLFEVKQDTADMKIDLDDLKVENQDWLTQERAEQIRMLVQGCHD